MEIFTLWLWPLIGLVVLPGLLVYFGLHVVERGIIFVDLALAQVAALGFCVAIVLGSHPGESALPDLLSLLFTMVGAALFSLTRFRHPRVPHESIIGIIYVVAAAGGTLVLSHSPEGDEALKSLLVGNILLVTRADVLRTAALYAGIGLVHYLMRRQFLMITFDEHKAIGRGVRLRLWDFAFYGMFGLVVTSFVRIAGVYLVFSYLIVPAVCGALLSAQIRSRLAIGWTVALLAGLAGLFISVKFENLDLPTGPTIVCAFGALLLICGLIAYLSGERPARSPL